MGSNFFSPLFLFISLQNTVFIICGFCMYKFAKTQNLLVSAKSILIVLSQSVVDLSMYSIGKNLSQQVGTCQLR